MYGAHHIGSFTSLRRRHTAASSAYSISSGVMYSESPLNTPSYSALAILGPSTSCINLPILRASWRSQKGSRSSACKLCVQECSDDALEPREQHRCRKMDSLIGMILEYSLRSVNYAFYSSTHLISLRRLTRTQESHKCPRKWNLHRPCDSQHLVTHHKPTIDRVLQILTAMTCKVQDRRLG
jgi:hypothetical protein